jgi:hypothetical protein
MGKRDRYALHKLRGRRGPVWINNVILLPVEMHPLGFPDKPVFKKLKINCCMNSFFILIQLRIDSKLYIVKI